jgi:hypothetical protein
MSAPALVSVLRKATGSLANLLSPFWAGPARKYRPEDHYMRGPGPKWRAKHFLDGASAAAPEFAPLTSDNTFGLMSGSRRKSSP